MKKIFFTVGPSQVYPTLEEHIKEAIKEQIPSLSHRGNEFSLLYAKVEKNLKKLLGIPDDYVVFFLGSSIEAMERIIQNTVERTSFHFIDGAFSQKAAGIAEELQKEVIRVPAPLSRDYDFKGLTIPKKAELIFITENDTSTGLIFPHEEIYSLRKKYPDTLIAVDLVSSAPYSSIDFSRIDLAFFSGQKGFGLPSGLSILVVSQKAITKSKILQKKKVNIGTYHNFPTLEKSRLSWQTPETPNVLAIYLLEKVLQDLLKKGMKNIREEIDEKASLLYNFFEKNDTFSPFVKDSHYRSPSTLVIGVNGGSKELRAKLSEKGIIVGSGYGGNKESHIRIANFPAHTKSHVLRLIRILRQFELQS
jgi:phosphoserine aminotransferase